MLARPEALRLLSAGYAALLLASTRVQTMLIETPVYSALSSALRERLTVIADRGARERDPQAHLRQLQSASEKIIALQAQLPAPVPAQLAHFLERCSYDKALDWIERQSKPPAAMNPAVKDAR